MTNSVIPTWWPTQPSPGNFGDILTPYIIKKISGKQAKYVNKDFKLYPTNLLAVGSIAKLANNRTVVWGSGVMNSFDVLSNEADYRAVRGPFTRELVLKNGGSCPEIYGDPALLLPKLYTPKSEKRYKYGIIPHYVDYETVHDWFKNDSDILVINLLNSNVESVIDEIYSCENVISSSLHGIITAQAYGVGAIWSKFSNKLHGDGVKFKDYFASVGIDMECIVIDDKPSLDEIHNFPYINDITYDGTKLLEAFPHDKF